MEKRSAETHVSSTETTVHGAAGRTVSTPRFDEKSIQRAQPAVPLGSAARRHSRSASFLLLCVLAGLAGGLLGAYVLSLYQRGGTRVGGAETTRADAQPAPEQVAQTAPAVQTPAAGQTAAAPLAPQAARREQAATAPRVEQPVSPEARPTTNETRAEAPRPVEAETAAPADPKTQAELRGALDEWLAATNARDVGRQMQFYGPSLDAFYLSRNASREAVRAEKAKLFAAASAVEVRASSAPEIRLGPDGRTAVMRFRKRYQIGGAGGEGRSGEVLQELRWRRTPNGWKIVGERDLRVLQ